MSEYRPDEIGERLNRIEAVFFPGAFDDDYLEQNRVKPDEATCVEMLAGPSFDLREALLELVFFSDDAVVTAKAVPDLVQLLQRFVSAIFTPNFLPFLHQLFFCLFYTNFFALFTPIFFSFFCHFYSNIFAFLHPIVCLFTLKCCTSNFVDQQFSCISIFTNF